MIGGCYLNALAEPLLAARAQLLAEGRSPFGLRLTAADLVRFGLAPWTGSIFGMRCEQPEQPEHLKRPDSIADLLSLVPIIARTGTYYLGGRL